MSPCTHLLKIKQRCPIPMQSRRCSCTLEEAGTRIWMLLGAETSSGSFFLEVHSIVTFFFSLHIDFILPILWALSALKSTWLPLIYGVYKALLLATCRDIPNSSAWRGILISPAWVTSISLSTQLWLRDLPAPFAHRAVGAVPGKQTRSQRNRMSVPEA